MILKFPEFLISSVSMMNDDDEMMQNKLIKEEIKDEIKEEIEEEDEVQDTQYFNEDEFILGGNSSNAGQAELSISEV